MMCAFVELCWRSFPQSSRRSIPQLAFRPPSPPQAAIDPSSKRWRSTDRGAVIRRYCFGRRFTTRGSTRLGRDTGISDTHLRLHPPVARSFRADPGPPVISNTRKARGRRFRRVGALHQLGDKLFRRCLFRFRHPSSLPRRDGHWTSGFP